MINVTINIESVFAQFSTANELKEVAQSVVNQVNAAYKARLYQIQGKTEVKKPVQIPVSVSGGGEKKTTKQKAPKAQEPVEKSTNTTPTSDKKADKKADKKSKEEIKQVSIGSLTKAQIKAMNIKFEKYSDKCMFLTGDTRCIKDEIMATNGAHWNRSRQGWFVKNDTAKQLAKALKIKIA